MAKTFTQMNVQGIFAVYGRENLLNQTIRQCLNFMIDVVCITFFDYPVSIGAVPRGGTLMDLRAVHLP